MELSKEQQEVQQNPKLIIVTGFGPFVGHEDVNASWEAVKLLPDSLTGGAGNLYDIDKIMVPVEYDAVDETVKDIWTRRPELVIHCGVHGVAKCIHVEKFAYNHKFGRTDFAGKRLRNCSACLLKCKEGIDNDIIRCGFNVDKIVQSCCDSEPVTPARSSNDVGNYLCGYIYLKSLDMDRDRTLFVHVPRVDQPFSSLKTSEIILKIIENCVHQLEEKRAN